MAKCKNCKAKIDLETKVCPECGAEVPKGFFATPWIMLLIVLFVIFEIISGRGFGQPPKTETPSEVAK